jgi:hypothetical protein
MAPKIESKELIELMGTPKLSTLISLTAFASAYFKKRA